MSMSHKRSLAGLALAGGLAAMLVGLSRPMRAWLRGFLGGWPRPRSIAPQALLQLGLSPEMLRRSMVGRGKSAIAAVLGVPRTAAVSAGRIAGGTKASFWSADTWYYAVDARTQTAMAVRFRGDIAREVEFFQTPALS